MSRRRTPPRPRPVRVGVLRASAVNRWRTNENGDTEFYWRIRCQGDRGYVWTGYGTRESIERQMARMVAAGRTGAAAKTRDDPEIGTLGEAIEAWYDYQQDRPDLQPSTVTNYSKAARHLLAWLASVAVFQVDRAVVEGYRNNRLREKAAPRTVELELKVLHMIWRWSRERGLVPARDLPRVRVKVDGYVINHRTPAPEEAASVLALLDGLMLLVLQLLAITGARVASICAVREGDLDEIRGLRIPDTKTGPRWFPVPTEFASSLLNHFASNAGPLVAGSPAVAPQIVRDRLKRACKTAGVKPFTPHGFRRMVVDRMIRGGVDPATAASLTGHSVEVMLRYYRKVTDEDRRQAVLQAGLGHFPLPGQVIEGPWDGDGQAAASGSGPDRGTEPGHNHGN